MGSPLVVALAVISVADVGNTALSTNTYGKFVDKRNFGNFRDKSHAEGFLNSTLTDDQQYNIEYVSQDGSLPYMDIFIRTLTNQCLSTENRHTPTSMSATIPVPPSSSKESVIRSLKRRAQCPHPMLSQHLRKELDTVYTPLYKMDTP